MSFNQLLLVVCGALAVAIVFVVAPRALMWMIKDDSSSIWREPPAKKRK